MSKNEKSIFLSQFKPSVEDGPINFTVLDAMYDDIDTKNGVKQIVKMKVELQERDNEDGDKAVKSINIFTDFTPGGRFYKFVLASVTALSTTSFQPSKLIGLKGEAVLSHYQPEGSDLSFPQLNDWVFYKKDEKVEKAIAKYRARDVDVTEVKEGEKNV